jgi:putative oxidoreductase
MAYTTDSQPAAGEVAERWWQRYRDTDARITDALGRISLPLLRVSLGLVFLWFGGLKVAGATPVEELVAATVYWVDPGWFVPALGVFEIVVGLGLIAGLALRLVLALFVAQMIGTFGVLVFQPQIAFQDGNPLALTVEGEFVIKNLVLLSAGLVVGSRLRRPRPWRQDRDRVGDR